MRNPQPAAKPPYPLESVDNALRLLQKIRDEGAIRIKEAAAELGVAQSTAHRLLSMLVYRGFATQDESRAYVPGPSLGVGPAHYNWTRDLRVLSEPHLQRISRTIGETSNLMIRVGTVVRVLVTIEGSNTLRIGDRQGTVLPAARSAAGKAMLAMLDEAILRRLYRNPAAAYSDDTMDEPAFAKFARQLELVRRNGYAINYEETERDLAAIGMVVRGASGQAIGAISVATPASRFRSLLRGDYIRRISAIRNDIERDLADLGVEIDGAP